MEKYKKDTIDNLADIFCAWAGGYPENRQETETFLKESHLDELIGINDFDRIINHDAYFCEENAMAVYALIPVKLKLKSAEIALSPQEFNRINFKTSYLPQSQHLNISFSHSGNILEKFFPDKLHCWEEHQNNVKKEKILSRRREKARLSMRKYRAEHPEKAAEISRKAWRKKTEEQKEAIRQASRIRNRKYREEHRIDIRIRHTKRREKLKQENPELLREKDRLANLNADRTQICKRYYEKHKDIIAEKARANPKTKEYKQRYKAKKRFQNTTGKIILPLLYGIINSKNNE